MPSGGDKFQAPYRRHPPLTDWVRSGLATAVVLGGGWFLVAMWRSGGGPPPETFAAATIAMMSGVLGYYFGSRGVDQAQGWAIDEAQGRARAEQGAAWLEDVVREYEDRLAAARRSAERIDRLAATVRGDPDLEAKVQDVLRMMEAEDP